MLRQANVLTGSEKNNYKLTEIISFGYNLFIFRVVAKLLSGGRKASEKCRRRRNWSTSCSTKSLRRRKSGKDP